MAGFHRIARILLVLIVIISAGNVAVADKFDEQLARKVSLDLVDTPLIHAVYRILRDVDVNVFFDRDNMTEEGIAIDEPVSRRIENVSAEQALGKILTPFGLTWRKTDIDEIRVTTTIAADLGVERLKDIVRFYDVFDLLASDQTSGKQFLSAMLETSRDPYREKDGAGGTVLLRNGFLVIWNSRDAHQEVANHLKALRKIKDIEPAEVDDTPIHKSMLADKKSHAAFLALRTPVFIDYEFASIETHLAKIAKQAKLEYQVGHRDQGLPEKFSASLRNDKRPFRIVDRPLITALEQLLMGSRLDFTINDGKLTIISKLDEADLLPLDFLPLYVRIGPRSGWDTQSVAEIVQDAVDRGEWESIDAQGGTIAHPLSDVLVIRNNVRVLYNVLDVLDQLKRRPQPETARELNRNDAAGIGRRAPNSDWFHLSDIERAVLKSQTNRLPEIDEVVCYRLNYPTKDPAGGIDQFKEKLHPFGVSKGVRLKGEDAVEIAKLWRNMSFHAHHELLTDVYIPWVELVFKNNGNVVSRTSISWSMNTVLLKSGSGKYQRYDYNPRTGAARRLKDRLSDHQALPPEWLQQTSDNQ